LVLAYQDVLFALQSEKGVNNGSPSLHARLLAELDVQIGGDRIVHVGAGTGYYSAILAELVGTSGHVHAVEMDPDLAANAAALEGGGQRVDLKRARTRAAAHAGRDPDEIDGRGMLKCSGQRAPNTARRQPT
jgi:protein-L-isoaspartate O-methyltransferase